MKFDEHLTDVEMSRLLYPTDSKRRYTQDNRTQILNLAQNFHTEGSLIRIRQAIEDTIFLKFNVHIRKNLYNSLLLTVLRGRVVLYGLNDKYKPVVQLLYNRYLYKSSMFLPYNSYDSMQVIKNRNAQRYKDRRSINEITK